MGTAWPEIERGSYPSDSTVPFRKDHWTEWEIVRHLEQKIGYHKTIKFFRWCEKCSVIQQVQFIELILDGKDQFNEIAMSLRESHAAHSGIASCWPV